MRLLRFCLMVACVLPFAPGALQADDAAVKEVLDKATKALGGPENTAKLKAVSLKGKITVIQAGRNDILKFEMAMEGLGKMKFDVDAMRGDTGVSMKLTAVIAEENVWIAHSGMTEKVAKEDSRFLRTLFLAALAASSPNSLRAGKVELVHGGEAKANDTEAVILRVHAKDLPDIAIHYDKKNGLPLISEFRSPFGPGPGEELNWELRFTEFKEVGGAKQFTKMKLLNQGGTLAEFEFTDFKVAQKFEDATFAKP